MLVWSSWGNVGCVTDAAGLSSGLISAAGLASWRVDLWFVKDPFDVFSGLFHQHHVLELEGMFRAVLGRSLTLGGVACSGRAVVVWKECAVSVCCFFVMESFEMEEVREEVDSGQDYGVHVFWAGSMSRRHLSLIQECIYCLHASE